MLLCVSQRLLFPFVYLKNSLGNEERQPHTLDHTFPCARNDYNLATSPFFISDCDLNMSLVMEIASDRVSLCGDHSSLERYCAFLQLYCDNLKHIERYLAFVVVDWQLGSIRSWFLATPSTSIVLSGWPCSVSMMINNALYHRNQHNWRSTDRRL